jgi:hypothetical protein
MTSHRPPDVSRPERERPRAGRVTAERTDAERGSQLAQLLERIQCGTIDDVDELEPHELALLGQLCRDGEDYDALLDRLRGAAPDGR